MKRFDVIRSQFETDEHFETEGQVTTSEQRGTDGVIETNEQE
jgi:putative ABC transport system ATP-binding protein